MDYEKAYKGALNRAKKVLFDCNEDEATVVNFLFPELAESEDERIRRELIEYLRGDLDDITTDDTDRWINWIEKQKDCFLVPKSHLDPPGEEGEDGMKILEKQKEIPMPNSTELIEMWHDEEAMLKEKDFRGDEWRLAYNAFLGGFARGTCVKFEKQKEQVMDETDKIAAAYQLGRSDERRQKSTNSYKPTYEQMEALRFAVNHLAKEHVSQSVRLSIMYDHLKEMEEQKPQKWEDWKDKIDIPYCSSEQEWSEEDEEMRMLLIAILEVNHPGGFFKANELGTTDMHGVHTEEIIAWLKSLRPSWKPSEEQLNALNFAITYFMHETNYKNPTELRDLYDDLLKLK